MNGNINEFIIKLNEEDFATLTAVLLAALVMAKDDEVKNRLGDLLHAITSQMN